MKPAHIASVVALTLATVAGVEMTNPRMTTRDSTVRDKTAEPASAATTTDGPRVPGVAVDTARPPVPLKVSHRAPVAPEVNNPADAKPADPTTEKPAGGETTEAAATAAPEQGSDAAKAAKAAIEADGYKGVQMLSQAGNGVWKASALRGRTRIVVNVDAAGNVFTE